MFATILSVVLASTVAQASQDFPAPAAAVDNSKKSDNVARVHNLLTLSLDKLRYADRTSAYLEQASTEIEAHTKEVSGMWFRSWRTGGVADRYIATATRLEEMAKYAISENLSPTAKTLNDTAASFREIAQYVSLGGSETVKDGTGDYTARIVSSIDSIHTKLNRARQGASIRLNDVSVEVDVLKAKLERLNNIN
jgi:uncharacterized protein YyaL (SSP411 family)